MGEEKRVVYEDSSCVIKLTENEWKVELEKKFFPLKGYGNKVVTYILANKNERTVEVGKWWDGWAVGGSLTGSRSEALVKLSDDRFDEFVERIKSVEEPDDFDKLVKLIQQEEEETRRQYEEKMRELVEKIYSLADEQTELGRVERLLRMSKKELKDWLEYAIDVADP